jgi:cation diffusion facilitator family transporter
MSHQSPKSIIYAFLANLGIAIVKTIAAIFTHSGSMLAEAIHSFADTGNQALLLVGLKKAAVPPNDKHPLGHGKEIYFWSFIVALMLFSLGGLFSIYEGIHKLSSTKAIENGGVALAVLGISIVLESLSLYGCLKEIKPLRKNQSLYKWTQTTGRSELVVVLGEDLAALFGLSFAFIAILISIMTNNPIFDAIGSIMIGTLLVIVALFIAVKIKSLLIGESVDKELKQALEAFISNHKNVDVLFNLIAVQMGNDVMLAVKAKMKAAQNADELINNINECEKDIREKYPNVVWIFFEPDNVD